MVGKTIINQSFNVEWSDAISRIDDSFATDVPLVPTRTSQAAVFDSVIDSMVEKLFDISSPQAWALFWPFNEYLHRLKRLFTNKVISSFDTNLVVEIVDNIYESGALINRDGGEKIYEMLHTLSNLNEMLEKIHLTILSSIRS